MPATASDDGVVLGLKFDISRVKQTLDQVKNMVQGMAEDSAKAVAKTDDALEKARKNAEKWKIDRQKQKRLELLAYGKINQPAGDDNHNQIARILHDADKAGFIGNTGDCV